MKYGYIATYKKIEDILKSKSIRLVETPKMTRTTNPYLWYTQQKEKYGYKGEPPKILKFKIEFEEVMELDND